MTRQLFDFTGGIRRWGWKGNRQLGDCVEAAVNDLITAKATANLSRVGRILFYLGFRRPGDAFTIYEYDAYLASLGEHPGPTVGTSPPGYLQWLKDRGRIIEWGEIEPGGDPEGAANAAAARFTGALLAVELTLNMYDGFFAPTPWRTGTGPANQPDPELAHAVAYVRATPLFDVVATWDANKAATPAAIGLITTGVYVFLCEADRHRPAFSAQLSAMQALPRGGLSG